MVRRRPLIALGFGLMSLGLILSPLTSEPAIGTYVAGVLMGLAVGISAST